MIGGPGLDQASWSLATDLAAKDSAQLVRTLEKPRHASIHSSTPSTPSSVCSPTHPPTHPQDPKDIAKDQILARAKAAGVESEAIKVNVHIAEPGLDKQDVEGATMAAMQKWTASKDATAAMDDPANRFVGSSAVAGASGRAYIVQLYSA